MAALITNLGRVRTRLLASIDGLSDAELNRHVAGHPWSIAEVVLHLCMVEKKLARTVLEASGSASLPTPERDLSVFMSSCEHDFGPMEPATLQHDHATLIRALEDARFGHVQYVFNKTHESELVSRSMDHPAFGRVSLKNLLDFVWLHELHHAKQIEDARKHWAQRSGVAETPGSATSGAHPAT